MTGNSNININNNFQICHLNCQSLSAHIIDLIGLLESTRYHIIGITETWLKPCLPDNIVNFPGYLIIRNDRIHKRGGGVALFVKAGLQFRVLSCSESALPESSEFLTAAVWGDQHPKILMSVVYRAPRIDYPDEFFSIISDRIPSYKHTFVLVDFNLNLSGLKPNGTLSLENRRFRSSIKDLGLHLVPFDHTYHVGESKSWLDVILVSDPGKITQIHQVPNSISNHDLVGVEFSLCLQKLPPRSVAYRDITGIDRLSFLEKLASLDWDSFHQLNCIDEKVSMLNTFILNTLDEFASLIKIKVKKKTCSLAYEYNQNCDEGKGQSQVQVEAYW